ncbi:hypothetical protein PILCRDRAFT_786141 [Piloderma croceum F 1598]|uniref:Enoyl-CoA hydratase n=1 Tax=Piloderma croceum (strain F 1598) TaxID=765440 RepID=A0A0C3B6V5_PILCF|nr:hypothetical protein PILCRDRAFT_804784 [Piloderma croceum F 1598]KIM81983.1 hypothetical protein PILCRDRAFT_786141 [Piloderma croceum F 1598]
MSGEPNYDAQGFKDIIVTLREPGVAVVVINRAAQRNTVSGTIAADLVHALDLFDRDDRVRVVVLTAEHTAPAFCSGVDISGGWKLLWDPQAEKEGEHAHRDDGGRIALAALKCRKITISAVNGDAAGVGITAFQLPFDFRFVWAGAKLVFPFVRRGISPEATSTFLLPRLIGHSRASSLLLSGEVVSPSSPLVEALYYRTFPTREEVFPAAFAFAQELSTRTSQVAVAYTKGLLQHPGDTAEENHLLDSRSIRLLASGKDGGEGVQSFKERRQPKFTDTLSRNSSTWYPWWRTVTVAHRPAKL